MISYRSTIAFGLVLSIGLSIFFCSNVFLQRQYFSHSHEMASVFSHTEHILSLTLAIVPNIIILVLLSFVLILLVDIKVYLPVLTQSRFFEESFFREQIKRKRYFFNLRSPPFY